MKNNKSEPEVLVIDDSEIALDLILDLLEKNRIPAVGLPGPIGATNKVVTLGIKVVVTDVTMPELSGNSLVQLFRNNPRTRHVKVVLVSDLPLHQLYELGQAARAHGMVQKARLEEELPQLVRKLLEMEGTPTGPMLAVK